MSFCQRTVSKNSATKFQEVEHHIRELLHMDILRESTNAYASLIVIVSKKKDLLELCIDYLKMNSKTIKDGYSLPCAQESFDTLCSSGYNRFDFRV